MMQIAADIIAVADLPFTRVRGDHRHAASIDQLSSKQARFGGRWSASAVDVGSKDRLHLVPMALVNDRRVVGFVRASTMIDPGDVAWVRQDFVELTPAERSAAE